uniref:Uncharacterized protein n=1 Tax=Anguilla anguilla TaxID=7936 RepID=A0A0E9WAJ2_ANGAN
MSNNYLTQVLSTVCSTLFQNEDWREDIYCVDLSLLQIVADFGRGCIFCFPLEKRGLA